MAETLQFKAEEKVRNGLIKKIAKEMKKDNEPVEKIMKYTGLSEDEIEGL